MEKLKSKLFEAATQNSTTSLHQLLEDDPLILDRCFVNCFNETPLHVAAMLGHVDFVKKIIEINPQLVYELNQQKRSPLHLAAAEGHVEVVTALLSVSQITCIARDRNGFTPVHLAAMKGRDAAVKLLLEAQPDAARKLVYEDEETILHLCVKNHQLEAIKLIVTALNDPEFVNSKDAHGNTALHLAMVDKQVETTEFLASMGAKAVEVKAQNRNTSSNKHSPDSEIQRSSEGILVVAILLAGMIFQNATNPPGGVWQEDNFLMDSQGKYVDPWGGHVLTPVDERNNTVLYPRKAGQSVLARNDRAAYRTLCYSNTIGFSTTLLVICLLMSGWQSNKLLVVIFYVMSFFAFSSVMNSYSYGALAVTPEDFSQLRRFVEVSPPVFFLLFPICYAIMKWLPVRLMSAVKLNTNQPPGVVEDVPEAEAEAEAGTEAERILRAGVGRSEIV